MVLLASALVLPAASRRAPAATLTLPAMVAAVVGVKVAEYCVPLPAKLLSVPPVTVTLLAVKLVLFSLRVNVSELVALAKGNELTYASWGVGSTSQVAMEMFKAKADVKILHVPYQGAAPAFQAIMAGQVDVMMAPASIVIPALSKVKAFGIASPQRFAGTSVPTLTEQGYAVDADAWVGLLAPPKTPQAVLDHIYKQVSAATADPEMKKRLQDIGLSSFSPAMSQEQFHNYMVAEIDRWGQVIRNAGIRLDN
jgi:tripartite-type tricarboxylate transporter receptor subunit TctC